MEPKVSVICLKNNKECIESLRYQTLKEIEILVSSECDENDERIKIGCEPRGKFILITDGNCTFEFNMLSTMVEIMEESSAELGICGVNRNGEKKASCLISLDNDDRKFLAMKELLRDGLFGTFNNAIMKNLGDVKDINSFYAKFKKLYTTSKCEVFSNTFVIENRSADSNMECIDVEELVSYFLERGVATYD